LSVRSNRSEGLIGDHGDGVSHQICGKVVLAVLHPRCPVLGRLGRLVHKLLVLNQVWILLVGLAAQESIKLLEAAPCGPVTLGRGHVGLILRAAVPLAEHVGVVALFAEHLGDCRRLEGNVPIRTWEAGGGFANAGRANSGVVATGQQ
jgi:hypothetical protein